MALKNILLINGHQPFPSSPGRLNASFSERGRQILETAGRNVRTVSTAQDWNIEHEVKNQLWADILLIQFPLNSMSVPWPLKRYLDEVYTAGMDGRLARGDGRTRSDLSKQYGSGGRMQGQHYMLSVTLNAPREAFDNPAQELFDGKSLDDLLAPVHINFAFFGLSALPTFAAHDVAKQPTIEDDFNRFEKHLQTHLLKDAA